MEHTTTLDLSHDKIEEYGKFLRVSGLAVGHEEGTSLFEHSVIFPNKMEFGVVFRWLNTKDGPRVVAYFERDYEPLQQSEPVKFFRDGQEFTFIHGEDTFKVVVKGYNEPHYLYLIYFDVTEKATGHESTDLEVYTATSAFAVEDWAKASAEARNKTGNYHYKFRSFECKTSLSAITSPMAVENGITLLDNNYRINIQRC